MRKLTLIAVAAVATLLSAAGHARASLIYALVEPGFVLQFDSATPGTITHVALITGLQSGERITGIDFRPRTGQLFGVGVVAGATDTIRTYTINPLTGKATLVPGSTPFAVTSGFEYGYDFNPTTDRIRIVNDGDENFRINPNNGARADTPTNDTDLTPPANQIRGVAYDRNFDTGVAIANRTTLYAISVVNSSLVTIGGINQAPSPNGGAEMNSQALGVTLAGGSDVGFDIEPGSNAAFAALKNNATGLTGLYTIDLGTGAATLVGSIGNGAFRVSGLAVVPANTLVTGTNPGSNPHVQAFNAHAGTKIEIFPYPGFAGEVRVATADVNLDGVPDIITGPGPGVGPNIKVFDGTTGDPLPGVLGSFLAFDIGFTGGVWVAGGDVNGDGFKDVIVGASAGVDSRVRVFSGADASVLADFPPYDGFTGGVRVAAADFDRDGDYEIVTGAGPGGGSHVRVFDSNGNPFTAASLPNFVNSFFAYPGFTGGVFVAAGDVNGDGVPDIITGAGPGGGPHVRVFSGVNGAILLEIFAYEASFTGGVRVAVADIDGDGRYEIITTPGPGRPSEVRAFDGLTGELVHTFDAEPGFTGGVTVGGVRR